MMDTPTPRRSRSRRAEREQHLYTARAADYATEMQPQTFRSPQEETADEAAYTPNEPGYAYEGYLPNEEDSWEGYAPNEEADPYAGFTPNEEPVYELTDWQQEETPAVPENAVQPDYAAYYSRSSTEQEGEMEPAFAPPPSMQQYGYQPQEWAEEPETETSEYAAGNVYHVRTATWADEEREEAILQSERGYQVQEEAPVVRRKKHTLRNALIVLLILALLAGAAWFLRDTIAEKLGLHAAVTEATEEPLAVSVTPEPIKAYDAAPGAEVGNAARNSIARLSGTLAMENHIVTDRHVVTRNRRADGSYDFYLFTAAEGRLLCYFEGLGPLDMIPQENNTFYVAQSPWLVAPGGSALIRTADIEAALNESVFLHPMYRGWAVVESVEDGGANYVNANGQLLSSLWFSRTFPFTGEYTLAYVDTGSTASADERYLLYVIGETGEMNRWLATAHMEDVVAAACGMAYMSDGALYKLPDTSAPLLQSPEVTVYLDCGAMVVRDAATGKVGLFVRGEQHYDFVYDSIQPLESDLEWAEKKLGSGSAVMTLRAVSGASWPQPLSHSFVLEKDGVKEYVALSAVTSCPIRMDGEF